MCVTRKLVECITGFFLARKEQNRVVQLKRRTALFQAIQRTSRSYLIVCLCYLLEDDGRVIRINRICDQANFQINLICEMLKFSCQED